MQESRHISAAFFKGSSEFECAHYFEAVAHFKIGVSESCACSELALGHCYLNNFGAPCDIALAEEMIGSAAEKGVACLLESTKNNAQALLWRGLIVLQGYCNIKANKKEAYSFFVASSALHNAYATQWIGKLYLNDFRYEAAVLCFQNALELDNNCPDALYRLGLCYEQGVGVYRDVTVALVLFRKSIDNGHAYAAYHLGCYYSWGYNGREPAIKKAFEWYKKSADLKYYHAFFELGEMYEKGLFPEKNLERACEYYEMAINGAGPDPVHLDMMLKERIERSKEESKKYCVILTEISQYYRIQLPVLCLAKIIRCVLTPIELQFVGNFTSLSEEQISSVICKECEKKA